MIITIAILYISIPRHPSAAYHLYYIIFIGSTFNINIIIIIIDSLMSSHSLSLTIPNTTAKLLIYFYNNDFNIIIKIIIIIIIRLFIIMVRTILIINGFIKIIDFISIV